jgi:sterol desaturase/sphingolipid hydroxylase (fatty acid hydroxylase superfamily)
MMQEPYSLADRQQTLTNTLRTLSAREQIDILLRSTRSLSARDRAEVLRAAGLSLLRDRFLSILFHIVIKRVLAGAIWWLLCVIAAVLALVLLAFIEQVDAPAVTPVIVAASSFFIGFLLFSLIDFVSDIAQFFRTTRSRHERDELLGALNACSYPQRVAMLRAMSVTLAGKVPGESLLASLLVNVLLLFIGALLIGLVMALSRVLPVLGSVPLLLLLALLAFLLGFFARRAVHHRLLARSIS